MLRREMQAFRRGFGYRLVTPDRHPAGMPTVFRQDGLRFYFFSSDRNEPAHVHVDRGGKSAKIWLERVQLARNLGFAPKELGAIILMVRDRRAELLEAWHVHFN